MLLKGFGDNCYFLKKKKTTFVNKIFKSSENVL